MTTHVIRPDPEREAKRPPRRTERYVAFLLLLGVALSATIGAVSLPEHTGLAWRALLRGLSDLLQLSCLAWLGIAMGGRVGAPGRTWLLAIAAIAMVARMAAALVLHAHALAIGPRALVLDDESGYDLAARVLLTLLADPQLAVSEWRPDYGQFAGPYVSFLSLVYGIMGSDPLLARLTGALIGTGGVLLGTLVTGSVFGRRAGVSAGLTLALMPSLVVWSATILRDSLISALVLLVFLAMRLWYVRPSWTLGVVVVATVYLLATLRLYVGLALGLLVAVALLVYLARYVRVGRIRAHARGLALSLVLLSVLSATQLGPSLAANLDPMRLLYLRTVMGLTPPPYELLGPEAAGATLAPAVGGPIVAVRVDDDQPEVPGMVVATRTVDASNQETKEHFVALDRQTLVQAADEHVRSITAMDPGVAQWHLSQGFLQGLAAALFAPFSTGIANLSYSLVAVDTALWLALALLAGIGAVYSRRPYLLLPLGFVLAVVLVLAIVPGNPGNLVRHRSVLTFPALAIAAAPALVALARRVRQLWPIANSPGRSWQATLGGRRTDTGS